MFCRNCLLDLRLDEEIDESNTITTAEDLFYNQQLKLAHSENLCYVCYFISFTEKTPFCKTSQKETNL
jgi:hypothetical protein